MIACFHEHTSLLRVIFYVIYHLIYRYLVFVITVGGEFVCCIFYRQVKGVLNSREREIASLRRQLDQSQEEQSSVSRDREIALRENRRLQDDLATMTREIQVYTHGAAQDGAVQLYSFIKCSIASWATRYLHYVSVL